MGVCLDGVAEGGSARMLPEHRSNDKNQSINQSI